MEDCGHVFESTGLEQWFAQTQDDGEIVQKTCPLCKTVVFKTLRFMDLIKPVMKTITDVKLMYIGRQQEIHKQREQLMKKLREKKFFVENSVYPKFAGYTEDSDELYMLYKKLQVDLSIIKNNRRNEIGIEKARLLGVMVDFVCMVLDKYEKCWEVLKEDSKLKVFSRTNFLVSLLRERKIKISVQEINSFILELTRLMLYIDLKTIVSAPQFEYCIKSNLGAQRAYINAREKIRSIKKFCDNSHSVVTENLNILRERVGSANVITAEEKKMILQAVGKYCYGGTAVGHFFTCGNGHPYIITECGGAMEESRCPVDGCGLVIGGQNHRLAEGQRLASDIDGARHAAWSSGNDMNNFQL